MSNAYVIGTADGVTKARSTKRMPEDECCDAEAVKAVRGPHGSQCRGEVGTEHQQASVKEMQKNMEYGPRGGIVQAMRDDDAEDAAPVLAHAIKSVQGLTGRCGRAKDSLLLREVRRDR